MVRIARIVQVGSEDVVVVGEKSHPKFKASKVGSRFVRLVGPKDVVDLVGDYELPFWLELARARAKARAEGAGRHGIVEPSARTRPRVDAR